MYNTEHENGVLICSLHRTPISKSHGRFFCLKCQKEQAEPAMDSKLLLMHAKSSLVSIERKLDLCNVPEHEKREIMQMVYAYASYYSQVDEAHKIADA